jgi:hypothetical protein
MDGVYNLLLSCNQTHRCLVDVPCLSPHLRAQWKKTQYFTFCFRKTVRHPLNSGSNKLYILIRPKVHKDTTLHLLKPWGVGFQIVVKIGYGPAIAVYDLTYIMSKFISSNRLNWGDCVAKVCCKLMNKLDIIFSVFVVIRISP